MVTNNLNFSKWVMGKCSQVNHIVVAFEEYSETSEQSKINKFTLEDLRKAKALCVGQRNSILYYLLENRWPEHCGGRIEGCGLRIVTVAAPFDTRSTALRATQDARSVGLSSYCLFKIVLMFFPMS